MVFYNVQKVLILESISVVSSFGGLPKSHPKCELYYCKALFFLVNFAAGRSRRGRYLSKIGKEEAESEVADSKSVPVKGRGVRGSGHNFWQIKMGSGLDLPTLVLHYIIFLYVRVAFRLTKF